MILMILTAHRWICKFTNSHSQMFHVHGFPRRNHELKCLHRYVFLNSKPVSDNKHTISSHVRFLTWPRYLSFTSELYGCSFKIMTLFLITAMMVYCVQSDKQQLQAHVIQEFELYVCGRRLVISPIPACWFGFDWFDLILFSFLYWLIHSNRYTCLKSTQVSVKRSWRGRSFVNTGKRCAKFIFNRDQLRARGTNLRWITAISRRCLRLRLGVGENRSNLYD